MQFRTRAIHVGQDRDARTGAVVRALVNAPDPEASAAALMALMR